MPLPIISADQRGIKGCAFGKSGIGKTSLLGTLPEQKTLFTDLEAANVLRATTSDKKEVKLLSEGGVKI